MVGDAALCRELVSMDAMTSVMAALASVSSDDVLVEGANKKEKLLAEQCLALILNLWCVSPRPRSRSRTRSHPPPPRSQ